MRKCFVIRPFSETRFIINGKEIIHDKREWEHIYNVWIKPSVESFPDEEIKCNCSELVAGNFLRGILQDINTSDFVIADLTGQKPNVYYELGVRHALRIGTIIITQDINALPSDLKLYSCIEYTYPKHKSTNQAKIDLFAQDLHKNFRHILQNNFPSDSPVSDLLELNHFFIKQNEMRDFKSMYVFIDRLGSIVKVYFEILKRIEKQKDAVLTANKFPSEIINISHINNIFSSLMNIPLDGITTPEMRDLEQKLFKISDGFNHVYHLWDIYGKNINIENTNKYFNTINHVLKSENKINQSFIEMKQNLKNLYKKKFNSDL